MFAAMNADAALAVAKTMHEIASRLDESVLLVQTESPDAFEAYRQAVGRVMGEMRDAVLAPLYAEHPELKPLELDDD